MKALRTVVVLVLALALSGPALAGSSEAFIRANGALTRCIWDVAMKAQEPGYPVAPDFGDEHGRAAKTMELVGRPPPCDQAAASPPPHP